MGFMSGYQRSLDELKSKAVMFWPDELVKEAGEESIVPRLLETQEQFIAVLRVDVPNIDNLFTVVDSSSLAGNMFLKHLSVLANVGGEKFQRINSQFDLLFPNHVMDYYWKGEKRTYQFKALPAVSKRNGKRVSLTNERLFIDKNSLVSRTPLSDEMKDAVFILLFGSVSDNDELARLLMDSQISPLLGNPAELEAYLRQRYIQVSRICLGGTANDLGHIAEKYIQSYLEDNLGKTNIIYRPGGTIPGVIQSDGEELKETTFDLVVSHNEKFVAIEVSFQVTTNSTVERKSGQARDRYSQIEAKGQKICYVLDGAGNLGGSRDSALNTICQYSHCTVAFRDDELAVLCKFIREFFGVPPK